MMGMDRPSFKDYFPLIGLLAITFLTRLHFFFLVRHDPAFMMPIVDSLEYDIWAYRIATQNWLWDVLPYHLPAYPYFVAAIYKLGGYNVQVVALIQYVLALGASTLTYFIACKLTDRATALIAVLFLAVYWFVIYLQTFLFAENLSLVFNCLLIFILLFMNERPLKYALAGMVLGLSVAARPDILVFACFFPLWLIIEQGFNKKTAAYYSIFLLGLSLVLAPIAMHNRQISNEPVFLRTQVGVNMYIGNRPDFKGQAAVAIGKDWEEIISMPHKALQREVSESESDAYFFNETFKIIRAQPLVWLKFMGGKIFSILSGRDFLRSEDVYFYNRYVLHTPYYAVTTRLIFILFLAGLVLSLRAPKKFTLLYLFLLAESFIIFFQIKTRYLLPLFPFVLVFAGLALHETWIALRRKETKKLLWTLAGLLLLSVATLLNPLQIAAPNTAETYYAIAKNYAERSQWAQAKEHFEIALVIDPSNVSAYNDLGLLEIHLGERARGCWLIAQALRLDPDAVKARLNYVAKCTPAESSMRKMQTGL